MKSDRFQFIIYSSSSSSSGSRSSARASGSDGGSGGNDDKYLFAHLLATARLGQSMLGLVDFE